MTEQLFKIFCSCQQLHKLFQRRNYGALSFYGGPGGHAMRRYLSADCDVTVDDDDVTVSDDDVTVDVGDVI